MFVNSAPVVSGQTPIFYLCLSSNKNLTYSLWLPRGASGGGGWRHTRWGTAAALGWGLRLPSGRGAAAGALDTQPRIPS